MRRIFSTGGYENEWWILDQTVRVGEVWSGVVQSMQTSRSPRMLRNGSL